MLNRISVLCACFICINSNASAAVVLLGGNVGAVGDGGNIEFLLTFDQSPDFQSVDERGRPADAFQFYIEPVPNQISSLSIIRGSEIRLDNDIRVRNAAPWDQGDPNSGGWGSIRGSVPYLESNGALTFEVPPSILNVSGEFQYDLDVFSYGVKTAGYSGVSGSPIPVPVVPEPSCFLLAAVGLLSLSRTRRR